MRRFEIAVQKVLSIETDPNREQRDSSTVYYLRRGLRSTNVAIPVDLIVAFDDRVRQRPFRSRSMMVARAMRHFLVCFDADWSGPDEPAHYATGLRPLAALMSKGQSMLPASCEDPAPNSRFGSLTSSNTF